MVDFTTMSLEEMAIRQSTIKQFLYKLIGQDKARLHGESLTSDESKIDLNFVNEELYNAFGADKMNYILNKIDHKLHLRFNVVTGQIELSGISSVHTDSIDDLTNEIIYANLLLTLLY